jgi:hypothetical protein
VEAGFTEFGHIQLDDLGFKKGESPATPENIQTVMRAVTEAFSK